MTYESAIPFTSSLPNNYQFSRTLVLEFAIPCSYLSLHNVSLDPTGDVLLELKHSFFCFAFLLEHSARQHNLPIISGKSSLLAVLGNREVPIQDHIDIYLLSREMPASEKSALEAVMEADMERIKLEKLAEELATLEDDESQEYLMEVRFFFLLSVRQG